VSSSARVSLKTFQPVEKLLVELARAHELDCSKKPFEEREASETSKKR